MDTDFLTEEAYRVLIGRSGEISEYLRAEIGSLSRLYPNEDSYLGAMHQYVLSVDIAPYEYLDGWNLLEEIDVREFGEQVEALAKEILAVIKLPFDQRGAVGE